MLTRGMSHGGVAIYMKNYLNAKEEFMKTQIFHRAKKYNCQKNL
jgi:hypothetical protein